MGLGTCLLTPCTIPLSPLACRVVWKHCQRYSVRCVSKIRSIFTFIFYIITGTGTGTYQLIHFCFDDFENISNSFYYHHQIENTIYQQIFRVRPWNKGLCCMVYYIIVDLLVIWPTGATPAKNTAYAAGALRNALTACNTLEGTKRFSGAVWISARNGQRTS